MQWGNLRNWLGASPRDRELSETRETWNQVERLWQASRLAKDDPYELTLALLREVMEKSDRIPAMRILLHLQEATEELYRVEAIGALVAKWDVVVSDIEAATEMREMLVRRRRWAGDFERMNQIFSRPLLQTYVDLWRALPDSCFGDWGDGDEAFEVTLVELLDDPASVIHDLVMFPYDDETLRYGVYLHYRERLGTNLLVASGFRPDDNIHERRDRLIGPTQQKGKSPSELADLYLANTPFSDVLDVAVPFHIPEAMRFEHCHIVGGTGHGKTQLMQRMIHADLLKAQKELRSVVVIDSQGDLINKLMRLGLFDPDAPGSLADRLVVIDPSDVEFPAALNLFDAHLDRVKDYRPVDRERVLNGVIELYEVFFGAMLGAELTQKQGVIFRYLARLMITIPDATIHTLMQLMEDGKPFKKYMDALDGSARYFFQTEFFHPSFSATKKQILKRLWGVLSTPAFERMFAQARNKLDLFEAINDGKIILISTAKDLLKQDGSALFGRFFIAMLAQAALERSILDPDDRTPTFVYVDEAQEYFDDSIETILNQARKYHVGLTLAHQTLDQLSPRLRSAIHANTSFKCVGGVSAKDARALADEMRTTSDFIESMRRRGERSEFAVWLKQMTPSAIRLSVPLGFLERQPLLTEEAFETLMEANRTRYCGTLADVVGFDFPAEFEAVAEPPAQARPVPVEAISSAPPARGDDVARPTQRPPVTPNDTPREQGKGGSQHRYVQQLIKGLAEERGFRAVIEEAVEGGQVDVGLHRDGLTIACEISVTSTADYEAQNLAKCLRAGFTRIWAIAPDQKRRRAIQQAAERRLGATEAAKVEFLTTEDLILLLDSLVEPPTEQSRVRGYRVKTTHRAVSPSEAGDRRATIARIVSQSMRGMKEDG